MRHDKACTLTILFRLAENGDYDEALKTLYLKTDQDLRAGEPRQNGNQGMARTHFIPMFRPKFPQ